MNKHHQSGQVIIILLLIIVVAMSVGISIIGRSSTEISTSNRVEDSTRAFFAAEAGIEQAIGQNGSITTATALSNSAEISSVNVLEGPAAGEGVEYPQVPKKDFAHVWFANPACYPNCAAGQAGYNAPSFLLYFGNIDMTTSSVKPAVEINIVTQQGTTGSFTSTRRYFDADGSRANTNKFENLGVVSCLPGGYSVATIIKPSNSTNTNSKFYCRVTVTGYPTGGTNTLILARMRLLYSDNQKVAIAPAIFPAPTPPSNLPLQTKTYISVGKSGNTQRVLKVIKENNVVPAMFDFAIFSTDPITKR